MIDRLPTLIPDSTRSARVIEKCHRKLRSRPKRQYLEPLMLAGFCALYLSSIALTAIEVFLRG